MRQSWEFESTKGPSFSKEIPLSEVRFRIPRRRLIRQSILSALLMSIPIGAFYLDIDRSLQWFALGFSAFFVAFLFLFSAVFTDQDLKEVDPVDYYGRGTLIGVGIFWLVLIAGIGWALYAGFPRP